MDGLAAWGSLLMTGSIIIGLYYCIVSVGFSAGVFHYQTLAVDAFRRRFTEITGVTVKQYVKALPRFRKFFSRISVHDGPISSLKDAVRMFAGRPVSLTNERRWKILDALQDGPTWRMTEEAEKRLLAVALYCANLPVNQPPSGSQKAKAFSGRRQAEILLTRTKVDLEAAEDVEQLFVVYQSYRAALRRKWFHALTGGHRKILKARATPQIIFWKKILLYSGTGGGVGTILTLCAVALRNDNLRQVPGPIIGAGVGLFLFATGAVKAFNRGRPSERDRATYRHVIQQQPLVATGMMSGQVVLAFLAGIAVMFVVLLALSFFQGLALGLVLSVAGNHA